MQTDTITAQYRDTEGQFDHETAWYEWVMPRLVALPEVVLCLMRDRRARVGLDRARREARSAVADRGRLDGVCSACGWSSGGLLDDRRRDAEVGCGRHPRLRALDACGARERRAPSQGGRVGLRPLGDRPARRVPRAYGRSRKARAPPEALPGHDVEILDVRRPERARAPGTALEWACSGRADGSGSALREAPREPRSRTWFGRFDRQPRTKG